MRRLSAALICLFIGLGYTQSALAQTAPTESVEPESVEADSIEPESVEADSIEPESVEPESPVTPSTLLPGFYLGRGNAYINSWRRVEKEGDRFCIEIAGGPPNPYAGLIVSTISSLSVRENQLYVDSSDFPLTRRPSRLEDGKEDFDFGPPFLRTEWIFEPPANDQEASSPRAMSEELTDCLAASETYTGYSCRWTNGRGAWLNRSTLSLPLSEELQQLAETSCERGAFLTSF